MEKLLLKARTSLSRLESEIDRYKLEHLKFELCDRAQTCFQNHFRTIDCVLGIGRSSCVFSELCWLPYKYTSVYMPNGFSASS